MDLEKTELLWKKSLEKSILNNKQLEFHNYFYLSFIKDKNPEIEMLKFRAFIDHPTYSNSFLVATLDSRSKAVQSFKDNTNNLLEICWFFPLSREKYRIKTKLSLLCKEFCINDNDGGNSNLEKTQKELILANVWDKHSKEEKKEFHNKTPDEISLEKEKMSDLDKFNSQDKNEISNNLMIILLEPIDIEHLTLPMPQVIADARHPNFESLFQPYKSQKKYKHLYNELTKKWEIYTVNP